MEASVLSTLRGIGLEPITVLLAFAVAWLGRELSAQYKERIVKQDSVITNLQTTLEKNTDAMERLSEKIIK